MISCNLKKYILQTFIDFIHILLHIIKTFHTSSPIALTNALIPPYFYRPQIIVTQ